MKRNYTIVKTAEDSMTTYRVIGIEQADDAAICQALTEAAKDVWPYLTTTPGTYTAAQLCDSKVYVNTRDGAKLPAELTDVCVECGTSKYRIGLERPKCNHYTHLFAILGQFERLARVKQNERAMFTARTELGELVCEARVIMPTDIKAICELCGDNPYDSTMNFPALDLDRQCVVASDGIMMVAKKVTVASIHYEDKVPTTFCLPKEVVRMQGEVTVQLFERGCAVTDQNGVTAEVEHNKPYPKWYTVWPEYRGGMTIVDSKVMTKVVKGAVGGLRFHGKQKEEAVLLTHHPDSADLCICGYDGAEKVNTQTVHDCIATDEVAWRGPVNAVRLQKVLALKPKLMWAGYQENSTLPDRIVLEDMEAQMAVMLMMRNFCEDLDKVMRETEAEFAVCGNRGLYRCFGEDSWLLEQVETKYPTCEKQPKPQITVTHAEEKSPKSAPRKVEKVKKLKVERAVRARAAVSAGQNENHEPSISDLLRAALRARLAA